MRYSLIIAAMLVGCASAPPVAKVTDRELVQLKIDCSRKSEQIKFIEQQISLRKFYTVDGVPFSEDPTVINKRFHAIAKVKIWEIREKCGH